MCAPTHYQEKVEYSERVASSERPFAKIIIEGEQLPCGGSSASGSIQSPKSKLNYFTSECEILANMADRDNGRNVGHDAFATRP